MSDTDAQTNSPPPSTAATLFQAGFSILEMLAQDATIFASAFGENRIAGKITTGLTAAEQAAPSLFNVASVLGAVGTLITAAGHAHSASTTTSTTPGT